MKAFLKLVDIFSHTILIVFVVFILFVAVLSSLLRHYSPDIDDYRELLLEQINSQNKDMVIDAGKISSDWSLFQPEVTLYSVSVRSSRVDEDLVLEKLQIKLNFIKSLIKWQLYFDYIELANLDVLLVEDESGHWSFASLASKDKEKQSLDDVLDRIWAIDELVLKNIKLSLLPYNGSLVKLPNAALRISSYRNKKQFIVQLKEADKNLAQVVINTKRKPGDKKFALKAYLKVDNYSLVDIASLFPDLLLIKQGRLSSESWIYWQNGQMGFNGQIAVDDLAMHKDKVQWKLASVTTSYHGTYIDRQWSIDLPKSILDVGENHLTIGKTQLRYADSFELKSAQLDIAAIHHFATLFPIPEHIKIELDTLSPEGYLQNMHFRLGKDQSFLMKAELRDVAVGAWHGAPELHAINGYMETTATNGFLEFDTKNFSMFFPRLYKAPMLFDKARGYIDWHVGADRILVNGKHLVLDAASGKAHGEFAFSLPRVKSAYETARLSLSIGMKNTAAEYRNIFIPFVVSENLVKWLDGNIKSGSLPEVGFIYHGPAQAESHEQRAIQLWLKVKDAALTYAEQWPAIEHINGQFLLDDQFAYARVASATTGKLSVKKAVFSLLPDEDGQRIEVSSEAEGAAVNVLEFLKSKPLADNMGHVIDSWKSGHGKISSRVDVVARLHSDNITTSVNVAARLENVDISLPQQNLTINKITGGLNFNTDTGLSSDRLDAVFWGKSIAATILSTEANKESGVDTKITLQGRVDIADVARWSKEPLVNFLTGSTVVEAEIFYGASGSGLRISSLLQGVDVKLPKPFLKKSGDARELKMHIPFSSNKRSGDKREIDVSYGEGINAHFLLANNNIEAGTINLGLNRGEYQKGKIILGGQVLEVDSNEWLDVIERYRDFTYSAKPVDSDAQPLVFLVENLQIRTLKAYGQTLDSVSFDLFNTVSYWQLGIDHKDLKAALKIYNQEEQPMKLHLHRVNLEFLTKKQEESGMSYANKTLSKFPDIDVTVDKVIYGGEDFGEWEFNVRSYDEYMALENMQASFKSMRLSSATDEGAKLSWTFGAHPQTQFQGMFVSENIADVLKAWGYKQEVKSQKAEFNVISSWNGVPADFSFYKVNAVTQMKLEKGNFADVSSSGTDALKLIGVFNIANLVKRLQLDFSDLTGQGLSYDTVVGAVSLDHGVYHFDQPIVIKSPASKIRLYGGFDMNTRQLDMTMGVTLPLASNLPWIVALAAGLPTAAGVFIVSKVLNKQVDQISSAVYEVTGAFDDPQIKFQSLFDTETDLEKQTIKQKGADKVKEVAE